MSKDSRTAAGDSELEEPSEDSIHSDDTVAGPPSVLEKSWRISDSMELLQSICLDSSTKQISALHNHEGERVILPLFEELSDYDLERED